MISGEFITYSLPSNQTLKLHHKRELGFQLKSGHSHATERSKGKVMTKGQEGLFRADNYICKETSQFIFLTLGNLLKNYGI